MSDLIVKDNALMNASYNLDLVEQRVESGFIQLDPEWNSDRLGMF